MRRGRSPPRQRASDRLGFMGVQCAHFCSSCASSAVSYDECPVPTCVYVVLPAQLKWVRVFCIATAINMPTVQSLIYVCMLMLSCISSLSPASSFLSYPSARSQGGPGGGGRGGGPQGDYFARWWQQHAAFCACSLLRLFCPARLLPFSLSCLTRTTQKTQLQHI